MDLFDLVAKITLDDSEYNHGIEDAKGSLSGFGDKLRSGLATAAKVSAAAIGAASVAVGGLVKSSVESYAAFEQLVGGVETLFKESSGQVQQYAAEAYKTAGLSANEYMQTVTGFSASLLQSLGGDTAKAADAANQAVIDMSDNANKMGTSMESIQNAYQGFAKQNFTMLDNLKLGYGGTKEEMARLLADAGKLANTKFDISSYADITEAIHVMQTEMGITGTTAEEAATTIEGSMSMLKASWANVLTEMASDSGNFDAAISRLVDSAGAAAENLIPRIEKALDGVAQLIGKLAPKIITELPSLITTILPSVLQSAKDVVIAASGVLTDSLPEFMDMGLDLIDSLLQGIANDMPAVIDGITQTIMAMIDSIVDHLPQIIESGIKIIVNLAVGLIKAIPQLVAKIPEIIVAIVQGLTAGISSIVDVGKNMIKGAWEGIKSMGGWLADKVSGFFGGIVQGVKDFLGIHSPSRVFASIGENMALGLGEGWDDTMKDIDPEITKTVNFKAEELPTGDSGQNRPIILTVASPEGKELARFVAPYMGAQLQLAK